MKPHTRGTELKVGTSRNFTQPRPDVETGAEVDTPGEENAPTPDVDSLTVPTTSEPKDL